MAVVDADSFLWSHFFFTEHTFFHRPTYTKITEVKFICICLTSVIFVYKAWAIEHFKCDSRINLTYINNLPKNFQSYMHRIVSLNKSR